jgi:predicted RecB family nuclease
MKRRKDMRQKYVISRDAVKNKLKIREYAIIDKNMKKVASSMLQNESFSFLCEETYESEMIMSSISKGVNALVAILRTHNIFPIEPYSTKIAESVMGLYNSCEDGSVELFFDDMDLVSV